MDTLLSNRLLHFLQRVICYHLSQTLSSTFLIILKGKYIMSDKFFYHIGLLTFFALAAFMFLISFFDIDISRFTLPCLLNLFTGLYCPGCGGTRAFRYLITGHIFKSIYYNPIVIYCYYPGLWFLFTNTLPYTGIKIPRKIRRILQPLSFNPSFIYVGVTLIVIQCIVKNILYIFFDYSILS